MDILKKLFRFSFRAKDLSNLIVSLLVYIVIDVVCGVVIGLLAKLPLIGWLFALVGSLVGLYAFVGIVVTVLVFLKVLK